MSEFSPDWTLAPAAALAEWMRENGTSTDRLSAYCASRAGVLIREVLNREPLAEEHAAILALGTGISAQFWLRYESNYRADLARGAKDTTPEGETP